MKKKWKDINGFKGLYKVSNLGHVLSLKGNRKGRKKDIILKSGLDRDGYHLVVLYKNKKPHTLSVHRLVAIAFISPFSGLQVNHLDGNKINNYVDNLEWCDASRNKKHSYDIGTSDAKGEKNGQSKLKNEDILKIRNMAKNGAKQVKIADFYCMNQSTIWRIINNKRWTHIK